MEELFDPVKRLKCGKAPGWNKITVKMIKNKRQKGTEVLLKIYNRNKRKTYFRGL